VNPAPYALWMAARSAGIVAYALAGAATLLGLAAATGALPRRLRPGARRLHEHLALAALAAVALHGGALLLDPWLRPGLLGVLIPLASAYRPLAVAAGVLAAYVLVVAAAAFYGRRRLPPGAWRRVHAAAPAAFGLGTLHALLAGSDAGTPWLPALAALLGVPIALLLALRLAGGGRAAPARSPASR
jgi:sulfoxide reductase heme-binding subunit YedZ